MARVDPEEEYPKREHFFWTARVLERVEPQPRRLPADVHSRLGPRRDERDDDRDDRAGRTQFYYVERDCAFGRGWPMAMGDNLARVHEANVGHVHPTAATGASPASVPVTTYMAVVAPDHRRVGTTFASRIRPLQSHVKLLWGSVTQQGPNEHDGIVMASGGLPLEVEDELPAPARDTPNHCEDPMMLEVALVWSPARDGRKAAPPVVRPFEPSLTKQQQEDHNVAGAEEAIAVEPQLLLPTNLARPQPSSVLGPPAATSINILDPPTARRSDRRAAKKKASSGVGGVQQASLLLQKRFDNASETHRPAGAAKEKFIGLFSTPLDPKTIQAIKALEGVDGKAQVDLSAMGLTAEDLSTIVQEIAVLAFLLFCTGV